MLRQTIILSLALSAAAFVAPSLQKAGTALSGYVPSGMDPATWNKLQAEKKQATAAPGVRNGTPRAEAAEVATHLDSFLDERRGRFATRVGDARTAEV